MSTLAWSEEITNLAEKLDSLSQKVSHSLIHSQMKTIVGNLQGASNALQNNGDLEFIASQLMKMFDTVSSGGVASTARSVMSLEEFEEFQDIMQAVNANAAYMKLDLNPQDRLMLLNSDDAEPRKWAALTLGFSVYSQNAVKPLIKALGDNDSSVRLYSALSLGRIGDTTALEYLGLSLMNDKHWGVRSSAAWALGQLNDLGANSFLERGLNDENKDVRNAAQKSLSKLN